MFVAARTEADRGNIGGYYHASDVAVRSVSNRTTIGSEKPSQRSEREARNLEKQAAEARGVSVAERDTAFALGVGAGLAALAGAEKPAAVLGIGAAGAAEASGMASEKADQVRVPPAEPGASFCEPLKAAWAGSLTRPRFRWATFSVAGHFHMLS
jgi:hypothetical protein